MAKAKKMEVLCDLKSCVYQSNGTCTADGISITAYNNYPDDIECNTYEWIDLDTDSCIGA